MLADKIDALGQLVRADDGDYYLLAMHNPKGEFEHVWRWIPEPFLKNGDWSALAVLSEGPLLHTLDGVEVEPVAKVQEIWPESIAFVLDEEGHQIDDLADTWETVQNFALNQGRKVIAFKDDGHLTKDEVQNLADRERALYRDCRGLPEDPKTT